VVCVTDAECVDIMRVTVHELSHKPIAMSEKIAVCRLVVKRHSNQNFAGSLSAKARLNKVVRKGESAAG
jgi:hypothetical protein